MLNKILSFIFLLISDSKHTVKPQQLVDDQQCHRHDHEMKQPQVKHHIATNEHNHQMQQASTSVYHDQHHDQQHDHRDISGHPDATAQQHVSISTYDDSVLGKQKQPSSTLPASEHCDKHCRKHGQPSDGDKDSVAAHDDDNRTKFKDTQENTKL